MKRSAGFTLIELLITIVVVAILAAIAVPMFGEQLAKSRRSEAISGLSDLMLRQERWRASHSTYGTLDQVTGTTAAAFNAAQPNYTFSVSGNDATDVLLTAVPKGAQAGDRCGDFTLQIDNGRIVKATSTGADRCWN